MPITIVRPSIVESALAKPRPGWIRGFRMADPVILSYAHGLLKEFPGVPKGIIDVIPVDLVTAAIIAVAAHSPRLVDGEPTPNVVQVRVGHGATATLRRLLVENMGRVVHRAPDLRRQGPADHRPQVLVPQSRPRPGTASCGPTQ